jgi:Zn ribbon nucleic-acid-binding protein
MPRETSLPPIRCPRCTYADPAILFNNTRIVTARCTHCLHAWVAAVPTLPPHVQRAVSAIERSRGQVTH